MGIGAGIFLLAVGAILTFALNADLSGINLDVVGVILMIAGALGIVLDLAIFAPRRRVVRETRTGPAGMEGTVVRDEDIR